MQNRKWVDRLYLVLILALIIFMIWIVAFLKGNAKDCLEDPIKHFEAKNKGVNCYCMKEGDITPDLEVDLSNILGNG